jgi:hypothetical protein
MKTIPIALVSVSVLALAACGGGSKGNSSNAANASSATEQVNTTSPLPPAGDIGSNSALNNTGPVGTNTLGTSTTGNTAGNTSGNLPGTGNNSAAANTSTTK